jgi:hypothetical protein
VVWGLLNSISAVFAAFYAICITYEYYPYTSLVAAFPFIPFVSRCCTRRTRWTWFSWMTIIFSLLALAMAIAVEVFEVSPEASAKPLRTFYDIGIVTSAITAASVLFLRFRVPAGAKDELSVVVDDTIAALFGFSPDSPDEDTRYIDISDELNG